MKNVLLLLLLHLAISTCKAQRSPDYDGVVDRNSGIIVYEEKNFRGRGIWLDHYQSMSRSTMPVGSIRVYGGSKARFDQTVGPDIIISADRADLTYSFTSVYCYPSTRRHGAILYQNLDEYQSAQDNSWYILEGATVGKNSQAWKAHFPNPKRLPRSVRIKGRAQVKVVGRKTTLTLTTGDYNFPKGFFWIRSITP